MQENEFEKSVRERMEALQLVPGENVWDNIALNILKEKRRKRFLIFLLSFLFLTGSGGIYFYVNTHNPLRQPLTGDAQPLASAADKADTTDTKNGGVNQVTGHPSKDIGVSSTNSVSVNGNQDVYHYQQNGVRLRTGSNADKAANNVGSSSETVAFNKKADVERNAVIGAGDERAWQSLQVEPSLEKQNKKITSTVLIQDGFKQDTSLGTTPVKEKKDSTKAILNEPGEVTQTKTTRNKKWRLGVTVFSGVSSNLSGLRLVPGGTAYSYVASPSGPSGGTSNGRVLVSKLAYKSGFSIGAGLYAIKQWSKRTGFSVGANYHFESVASEVGGKTSADRTFYDSVLGTSTRVHEYYDAGQSVRFTNKYQLFELPLHVFVLLNKDESKPVLFSIGLTPAYLMDSKALYANYGQNVYYADNSQFRKILMTAQAGVQLPILNQKSYQLTGGPELFYGINNMAKPATGTNQHLFTAAIKLNLTLR